MIEYRDLRGRLFRGFEEPSSHYILRIQTDDYGCIVRMHCVDPITLAELKDITSGWAGETPSSEWTLREVDESMLMDEGL